MKPRIVGEEQRGFKTISPPPVQRIHPHFWLRKESSSRYDELLSKRGFFPLYISKKAEEKMRNHALAFAERELEVMGFLLGDIYKHEDAHYAVIKDSATGGLDASLISVKFEREGFAQLFESLDSTDFDYLIVGWYHSHPGHTCFMSPTDIDTQKKMFGEEYQCALVIDPVNLQIEAYGLEGGEVKPKPFAVYWDEYEDPYGKKMKRVKRK